MQVFCGIPCLDSHEKMAASIYCSHHVPGSGLTPSVQHAVQLRGAF